MAQRPKRYCRYQGCHVLVDKGYCDAHKPRETRPNAYERGYVGAAWDAIRKQVFLRDGYVCQIKGPGCRGIVGQRPRDAHCDHKIPKHLGGTDDIDNLQTACDVCHGVKTRNE